MQRMTGIISMILFFLLSAGTAQAASVYYTFEGTFQNYFDYTGQSSTWGDFVNQSYTMTWLFDTSAPAASTQNDGDVQYWADNSTSYVSNDFFYAELTSVTGFDVVQESGGGYYNDDNHIADFDVGQSVSDLDSEAPHYARVSAWHGSQNRSFVLDCLGVSLSMLVVGLDCLGGAQGVDSTSVFTWISADMKLTSISAVPLPAAAWLFGTAIMGMVGFNRRKTKLATA